MTYLDKPATPQESLAHHGVKGMRWGVRKQGESSSIKANSAGQTSTKTGMSRNKKIAIGLGVLVAASGATYVAYSLNQSGSLPFSSLKKVSSMASTVQAGEKAAAKTMQPPTDIIHLARGKNKGLTFLKKGETPDYFQVFDKLGMNRDLPNNFFEKSADDAGHTIARLLDPGGRSDFAGRPITHDIVIPKSMADGINSIEDVKTKVWPKLKDTYDQFYKDTLTKKY